MVKQVTVYMTNNGKHYESLSQAYAAERVDGFKKLLDDQVCTFDSQDTKEIIEFISTHKKAIKEFWEAEKELAGKE